MKNLQETIARALSGNLKIFNVIDKELNLKKILSNSKKHLDLGCGFGFFTKVLIEKFEKIAVEGIDIDCNKIAEARRINSAKNVRYICTNELTRVYDSASAIFMLHHSENPLRVLKGIYRHLRPGGRLIVYEFVRNSKNDFRKLYEAENFDENFEKAFKDHNKWAKKEFVAMAERAGFKTEKVKTDKKYWIIYLGKKENP